MNEPIATRVLERAVTGRNLTGQTLGEQIGAEPMLLVFLRHLG